MRNIWLCEELGLPYEAVAIDFSPAYRQSPEWRAKHPQGKVPVMADGEVTIFESCAINQYLLDRYGEGRLQPPPGTAEAARYQQWWLVRRIQLRPPLGRLGAPRTPAPPGTAHPRRGGRRTAARRTLPCRHRPPPGPTTRTCSATNSPTPT